MPNNKHKHHDVLIAIAEGREVQFKSGIAWADRSSNTGYNPFEDEELEWRVKPELSIRNCYKQFAQVATEHPSDYDVYEAGFLRGVYACQNGEYY